MIAQAFKAFLSGTFLAAGAIGAIAPSLQKWLLALVAAEHALRIDSAIQVCVPIASGLLAALYSAWRKRRTSLA